MYIYRDEMSLPGSDGGWTTADVWRVGVPHYMQNMKLGLVALELRRQIGAISPTDSMGAFGIKVDQAKSRLEPFSASYRDTSPGRSALAKLAVSGCTDEPKPPESGVSAK